MGIIVKKFGGTSVATIEKLFNVANRIIDEIKNGNQVITVVSAMGKQTDELIELANQIGPTQSKRELDMLLSTGEQVTIALLTMVLQSLGVKAVSLTGWQAGILTESVHGNARVLDVDTTRLQKELQQNQVVIVAGFQGITKEGNITTLGRGGSDTTAVALAAAMKAERCDIFTDVTGVFTSDPRYIADARQLPAISYDEMLELANLGAGVLHPRAVEFAKNYHIPLVVCSSLEKVPGTYVWEEAKMEENLVVRGIAFEKDITKVTIYGIPNALASLPSIFTPLAENHVNVDIIIQSTSDIKENNVSFSIKTSDLDKALDVIKENKAQIQYDHVEWESRLGKVSIVGSGMISNPGVAAQMFGCLASNGIQIKMVSTSEIKVSVVVDDNLIIPAAEKLHETFKLSSSIEKVTI